MTVQRAIASPHLLAEKTLKKILVVMEQLGYIPDKNASGLVQKSSGFLGMVVSSVTSSTFAGAINGITDFGLTAGREILLSQTNYDLNREYDVLRNILGRRPDGLILTFSPKEQRTLRILKQAGVPIVETWDDPTTPLDMVAGISNVLPGQLAAKLFAETGRKQPAFFGQLLGRDITRWQAFSTECQKLMSSTPLHIQVGTGQSIMEESFEQGDMFFDTLKKHSYDVDCVFCSSDITAAGIIFAAQRRAIRVPEDLAVCGLGNLPFAQSIHPRLTTINVPAYEMGQIAGQMILAKLTQRPGPKRRILDTQIIVREST